ncbi:hypothetical protein FEM03_23105 [Phragmitibacter flavus]|uniref:Uncharacterized protein n=1 Tax=Phragmitibacter flavus TaxID=2576071 RepID=A0A5R8K7S9_9BACT|nr:hypothetical protein [Phragmitibacter flavus]TLD68393.1 hypothetical protein FEM03_23105 [Phragmitibacter flavus]
MKTYKIILTSGEAVFLDACFYREERHLVNFMLTSSETVAIYSKSTIIMIDEVPVGTRASKVRQLA